MKVLYRQKNWQGNITHACSWDATAMKNHYLMTQISDMVKQLYKWFCLKMREIKKKQKNISSELLASFGRQLTEQEDIFRNDTHSAPANWDKYNKGSDACQEENENFIHKKVSNGRSGTNECG